jgi:hypothetical protein
VVLDTTAIDSPWSDIFDLQLGQEEFREAFLLMNNQIGSMQYIAESEERESARGEIAVDDEDAFPGA